MGNPHRGEQTVSLGDLGTFTARPDFHAISRIESATGCGVMVIAAQLIDAYSLTLVTRILFECIRAAQPADDVRAVREFPLPTYEQVGRAVQAAGVDLLVEVARALIMANFSNRSAGDDDDQGDDDERGTESPGNAPGATKPPTTEDSPPPAS